MPRIVYPFALVLLGVSNALAGTVTFTPLGSTNLFSGPNLDLGPASVDFQLGVKDDFNEDLQVTALSAQLEVYQLWGIPSIHPPALTFVFSDDVLSSFQLGDVQHGEAGDLFLDAFSFTGGLVPPISDLGTLTVDATTVDGEGGYEVVIRGLVGDDTGQNHEVHGSGYFTVNIPEPSTVVLLVVGLLGIARVAPSRALLGRQAGETHG